LGLLEPLLAAGARPLNGVRYTIAGGASAVARFPALAGGASFALGVRRTLLDRLLLDRAGGEDGVRVEEGFAVREIVDERGRLAGVTNGCRTWRARVIVGADGLRSTVRRALGWGASSGGRRRYAVVGHFRVPASRVPPLVDVVFAEGVESYLTPLGNDELLV